MPTLKVYQKKNDVKALGLIAVPFLAALLIGACTTSLPTEDEIMDGGPSEEVDLSSIGNAVPKQETLSYYGNNTYFVYDVEYEVLDNNVDFKEEGIASWYGTKFHGNPTSTREKYDMYAMTAAHKTLPIPSYVKVTNVDNGKEIIVRVNDRGPFKDDRIIDLSYVAAHKLDMHEKGTAAVKIEALPPFHQKPPQKTAENKNYTFVRHRYDFPKDKNNYLQIGVFINEEAAQNLQSSLLNEIKNNIIVLRDTKSRKETIHKVRIGPIPTFEELEAIQEVLIGRNIPHYYLISE